MVVEDKLNYKKGRYLRAYCKKNKHRVVEECKNKFR